MKYLYILLALAVVVGGFAYVQSTQTEELIEAVLFEEAETVERRVELLKSNKEGDPNANKHDLATEACDAVDQDCIGEDDVSAKSNHDKDSDADDFGDTSVNNDVDNDCDDPHGDTSACAADIVCGSGTVSEEGPCVPEKLDDDDDGDSVPTEDESVQNTI